MTNENKPTTLAAKLSTLLEVVLVFALLHVTYRAIKHFTTLGSLEASIGLNLTPGLTMIAFTVAVVRLHGRRLASYGLTLAHWPQHLGLAIVCILIAAAVAAPSIVLINRYDPRWAAIQHAGRYRYACLSCRRLVVPGVIPRWLA